MGKQALRARMKKLFMEDFTARDIAEPLLSLDGDKPARDALSLIRDREVRAVGIRVDGQVAGYVTEEDSGEGACRDRMHEFESACVIAEATPLQKVLEALDTSPLCFVNILGSPVALVVREDVQKPPVRMWLFGLIAIVEMNLTRQLEERYPEASWREVISPGRFEKALELLAERSRRNQLVRLSDCLQFTDKAQILIKDPEVLRNAGFSSKKEAQRAIQDLQSLRNNLAHGQDILSYDWDTILELSRRLDRIITRI
jgi:hypothetical protein